MADPITIFGAAAGALQLTDVALRASRDAYGFLAAVKDASKDVQVLRDTLRDVEDNVRSLRTYIIAFGKSKGAREEFEVLPGNIIRSMTNFCDDIGILKSTLPPKPSPSVAEKLKWVCSKNKIKSITDRLLGRKADLGVALLIIGRLHDLRLRQDLANLHNSVKNDTDAITRQHQAAQSSSSGYMLALNDHFKTQHEGYAQLLQRTQQINADVRSTESIMHQDQEKTRSILLGHSSTLNNLIETQVEERTHLLRELQQSTTTGTELLHRVHQSQQSLDAINSGILDLRSETVLSATSIDVLTKVFRAELQSHIGQIVDQTLNKSDSRNETKFRRVENMIDAMSTTLGQRAAADNPRLGVMREEDCTELALESAPGNGSHTAYNACNFSPSFSQRNDVPQTQSSSYVLWFRNFRGSFGSIHIEVHRINHRKVSPIGQGTYFSIIIHFRPSQYLLQVPGISAIYSNAPNEQGFYQLAPMITTFQIISEDHPILDAIYYNDLKKVQEMFATGKAHPRCQFPNGMTPLHYAVIWGQPDVWIYLLSIGLSIHQRNDYGITPLEYLLIIFYGWMFDPEFFSGIYRLQYQFKHVLNLLRDYSEDLADAFMGVDMDFPVYSQKTENKSGEMIDTDLIATFLEGFGVVVESLGARAWQLLICRIKSLDPSYASLTILKMCLHKGLDPNFSDARSLGPLLFYALVSLQNWKRNLKTKLKTRDEDYDAVPKPGINATSDICGNAIEVVGTHHNEVPLWCVLTVLIKAGADIYYMEPCDFDRATDWEDIRTLFTHACALDLESEWEAALQECGIDPNEALKELEQRTRNAMRLRGARCTGVDEEDVILPSFTGLRHRFHPRKAWYWDEF